MNSFRKAFSLIEVLITVGILTTAIVFIFQAFTASLNATKLSQEITLACTAAEEKLWEIEQLYKDNLPLLDKSQGEFNLQNKNFTWDYEISDVFLDAPQLRRLKYAVSWEHKDQTYSTEVLTYLYKK